MVVLKIRVFLSDLIVIVLKMMYSLKGDDEQNNKDDEADMSLSVAPWLVPVPVEYMRRSSRGGESVKKQLAVVQYQHYCVNSKVSINNNMCIVCMNEMEGREGVRELCNCSHAFHTDCLDAWIDEGHLTCPLCRSMLLPPPPPDSPQHLRPRPDPWRTERMIYLFGHDNDYT